MKIYKEDKKRALEKLREGRLESAKTSVRNFAEEIMKKMLADGLLGKLGALVTKKRGKNTAIPLETAWTLGITAKMKQKMAMTDMPYAVEDHELLARLGYNMLKTGEAGAKGLLSEGEIRQLFGTVAKDDYIEGYNTCVQKEILPQAMESDMPSTHILDCTKLVKPLKNANYEGAGVVKDDEGTKRGYKLGTLRRVVGDAGVIEAIALESINTHDYAVCKDTLMKSPALKAGDSLLEDRGFLAREAVNYLKSERGVDVYVPLRKEMAAYEDTVILAKMADTKWVKHPNKKRATQEIAFIEDAGRMWESETPEKDVRLNACVAHDKVKDEYYVFVTTDMGKTARQIIMSYEMRPEIEEDYRQLKDFWRLEDFTTTKINLITFNIVCTMLAYLFFQLYVLSDAGARYRGESLPVILKHWDYEQARLQELRPLIFYIDGCFAILPMLEFMHFYASLDAPTRDALDARMS